MIIGHERIIRFLKKVLGEDIPIHAFLFYGPSEIGKREAALELTKGFLCDKSQWAGCHSCESCIEFQKYLAHRDFLEVKPVETSQIGISESRAITKFLSLSPQLAKRKAVLVDSADELTAEAQNALLKTLEEPSQDALLIFITAKPGKLFETVRSRLVPIHFRRISDQKIIQSLEQNGVESAKAKKIAKLSFGKIGRALLLARDPKLFSEKMAYSQELDKLIASPVLAKFAFAKKASTQNLSELFATWQILVRDELLKNIESNQPNTITLIKALSAIQKAAFIAEDTTVSKRLLLENLLFSL